MADVVDQIHNMSIDDEQIKKALILSGESLTIIESNIGLQALLLSLTD